MNKNRSPESLIGRPPYKACPKCKEKSFGILLNGDHSYFKKCHGCYYEEYYEYPKLNKKIIYLDQFVISKIYKSSVDGNLDKRELIYFKKLYEILTRLIRMNAIVCPISNIHFEESVVHPNYRDLIKLYTQLSTGITLFDTSAIRQIQIIDNFKQWLNNKKYNSSINIRSIVLLGNVDLWVGSMTNSVSGSFEEIRRHYTVIKKTHNENLMRMFRGIKENVNYSENNIQNELRANGEVLFDNFLIYLSNRHLRGFDDVIYHSMFNEMMEKSIPSNNIVETIKRYTGSDYYYEIPYLDISTRFISILIKRTYQRKNPYKHNDFNDVEIISSYLPYSDAMFIDQPMQVIVNEIKYNYKNNFPYQALVFSERNKDDFINYLKNIENGIEDSQKLLADDLHNMENFQVEDRLWTSLKL